MTPQTQGKRLLSRDEWTGPDIAIYMLLILLLTKLTALPAFQHLPAVSSSPFSRPPLIAHKTTDIAWTPMDPGSWWARNLAQISTHTWAMLFLPAKEESLNRDGFVHPTNIQLEQPSSFHSTIFLFQHMTNIDLVPICFASIGMVPSSSSLFRWHSYRKGHSQLLTRFPQPVIQDSSYTDGIRVALEHLLQYCNYIYAFLEISRFLRISLVWTGNRAKSFPLRNMHHKHFRGMIAHEKQKAKQLHGGTVFLPKLGLACSNIIKKEKLLLKHCSKMLHLKCVGQEENEN